MIIDCFYSVCNSEYLPKIPSHFWNGALSCGMRRLWLPSSTAAAVTWGCLDPIILFSENTA